MHRKKLAKLRNADLEEEASLTADDCCKTRREEVQGFLPDHDVIVFDADVRLKRDRTVVALNAFDELTAAVKK